MGVKRGLYVDLERVGGAMNTVHRTRSIPLLLALALVLVMAVPAISMAATVPLGRSSSFAVLAYSSITNVPALGTAISGGAGGDIGVSAGTLTSITGFPPGTYTGTAHGGDSAAQNAMTDALAAYNNANDPIARPTIQDLTGQDLGSRTLGPGVYSFSSSAGLTGDLTLDAGGDPDAVFIFRMGSSLTTASGSRVLLVGSARPCRVFWVVGSSATLGTTTQFVGHIFAMASITANTNAAVDGQLMALNGAVTLDHNIITNRACATLHVIKQVDGGTSVADDFMVHLKASDVDVDGSPQHGAGSPGTAYTLDAGTYVVSEDADSAYTVSYIGEGIDSSGRITVAADDDVTVRIVNTYVGPIVQGPAIHVVKTASRLTLTSGGSVTYTYRVTNPGTVDLSDVTVTDDKVSPVTYVSGDVNGDGLLQPGETWVYTATTTLDVTTTNTATATGVGNVQEVTDTAVIRVVVRTGGEELPTTSTPWYNLLLAGCLLASAGVVGYWRTTRKTHA